jgi:hypothetical protein
LGIGIKLVLGIGIFLFAASGPVFSGVGTGILSVVKWLGYVADYQEKWNRIK